MKDMGTSKEYYEKQEETDSKYCKKEEESNTKKNNQAQSKSPFKNDSIYNSPKPKKPLQKSNGKNSSLKKRAPLSTSEEFPIKKFLCQLLNTPSPIKKFPNH